MLSSPTHDHKMQTADAMGSIITDEDDEESMESEDEYGDEVPLDELVE